MLLLIDACNVLPQSFVEPVEPGGPGNGIGDAGGGMELIGMDQTLDGNKGLLRVTDPGHRPGLGELGAPDVDQIRLLLLKHMGKIRLGVQQQVGGVQVRAEADLVGVFPGGADDDAVALGPDGLQRAGEPAAEDGGLLAQMHRQLRHHDIHKPEDLHAQSSFRSVMPT